MTIDTTTLSNGTDFGPTLIDTGTTLTYVPTAVASGLLTQVTGSSGFKAMFAGQTLSATSCVSTQATPAQIDAALPVMSISFPDGQGGSTQPISLPPTRSYLWDNGGGTWCLGVLDNAGLGASIIGNVSQEAFLAVFDVGNQQVGFAVESGCGNEDAVRDHVAFPPAAPGQPWWSTNPRFRAPRPRR